MAYDWPGNVRQLRNVVETMVVVDSMACSTSTTCRRNWPMRSRADVARRLAADGPIELVGKTMDDIERWAIEETLKLTGGNREEAAKILGHRRADAVSEVGEVSVGQWCQSTNDK